jgi:hypothetical protein
VVQTLVRQFAVTVHADDAGIIVVFASGDMVSLQDEAGRVAFAALEADAVTGSQASVILLTTLFGGFGFLSHE